MIPNTGQHTGQNTGQNAGQNTDQFLFTFCQLFVHFLSDPIGRAGRNNQQVKKIKKKQKEVNQQREDWGPLGPQSSLFWLTFFCFFLIFLTCWLFLPAIPMGSDKKLTKNEQTLTKILTSSLRLVSVCTPVWAGTVFTGSGFRFSVRFRRMV